MPTRLPAKFFKQAVSCPPFISVPSSGIAIITFAVFFALVLDVWRCRVHRLQQINKYLRETHKFHHGGETALNATTHARACAKARIVYADVYSDAALSGLSVATRDWRLFAHAGILQRRHSARRRSITVVPLYFCHRNRNATKGLYSAQAETRAASAAGEAVAD
jgi:hypothetical protein